MIDIKRFRVLFYGMLALFALSCGFGAWLTVQGRQGSAQIQREVEAWLPEALRVLIAEGGQAEALALLTGPEVLNEATRKDVAKRFGAFQSLGPSRRFTSRTLTDEAEPKLEAEWVGEIRFDKKTTFVGMVLQRRRDSPWKIQQIRFGE